MQTKEDRRPFQTVKDFAKKKGVGENAIYKQAQKKDRLEVRKIGSMILVRDRI